MGGFQAFPDTQFVGTDELGAVSSYQPCHIFGDSMLIGLGIRLSFYLLYLAAIIAVIFGVDRQFRFWHGSWAAIALSTFISLCVNATTNTAALIVIDWAILIQLILWYPVFFIFLVFNRHALAVARYTAERPLEELRARLEVARRQLLKEEDWARARAYINVLKAFAAQAAAAMVEDEYLRAQADLARCIRIYVDLDDGIIATVYHLDTIAEVAAAPRLAQVEAFRDYFVATLVRAEFSIDDARATEREAAIIAAEELQIQRKLLSPTLAIRNLFFASFWKDRLAAATGLLVFSVYMLVTPWLYSRGLDFGRKPECDSFVRLLFVLAPLSPFSDNGFRTFLLVFGSGSVVVALITASTAIFIIIGGLFGGTAKFRTGRSQQGKRRDETEDELLRNIRALPGYSVPARQQAAQDILLALHAPAPRGHHHRQSRVKAGSAIHFSPYNLPWALLLLILLIETIATVEETVRIDRVDFFLPPLHETTEILAFIIGALTLILVVWSIISSSGSVRVYKAGNKNSQPHEHKRESEEAIWQARKVDRPGPGEAEP